MKIGQVFCLALVLGSGCATTSQRPLTAKPATRCAVTPDNPKGEVKKRYYTEYLCSRPGTFSAACELVGTTRTQVCTETASDNLMFDQLCRSGAGLAANTVVVTGYRTTFEQMLESDFADVKFVCGETLFREIISR